MKKYIHSLIQAIFVAIASVLATLAVSSLFTFTPLPAPPPTPASVSAPPVLAYDVVKFDVAGHYTWRVPEGVTRIYVTASGAGGGGGGGGLNYDVPEQRWAQLMRTGGGGGGGASFVKREFEVSPEQVLEIYCGKGGAGGYRGSRDRTAGVGEQGEATYIQGIFSLTGGWGAKIPEHPHAHSPALGGLPGGKGGQRGGFGDSGNIFAMEISGSGGDTLIGFGGRPGNVFSTDGDSGYYGGGGGGGGARGDTNTFGRGGDGSDGVVIIEWSQSGVSDRPEVIRTPLPDQNIQDGVRGESADLKPHPASELFTRNGGMAKFDVPGKYLWTVPEDATTLYISAAGGGGGGGGAGTLSFNSGYKQRMGAGGGGAAAVLKEGFVAEPGRILSIVVGAGGRGGRAGDLKRGGGAGGNGSATIVGDLITVGGGQGARLNGDTAMFPGLSGGGGGGHGKIYEGYFGEDVSGGATLLGWGGRGGNYASPGYASHGFSDGEDGIYGGGGGGGYFWIHEPHPVVFSNGGNGGDGVVIIEWSGQEIQGRQNVRGPEPSEKGLQTDGQVGDAHAATDKIDERPNLVRGGPEVKWPELRNGKPVYKKLIVQPKLLVNQANGSTRREVPHNIPDVDEIWIDMERSSTIWQQGSQLAKAKELRAPVAGSAIPDASSNATYWWTCVTKTAIWYEVGPGAAAYGPVWEVCLSYTKLSDRN